MDEIAVTSIPLQPSPAEIRRLRAQAEDLVRAEVDALSLQGMPTASVRDRLAAQHEHLETTASPLALATAWRK
ncbi:MAG: hypothetical protein J0I86_18300 [Mesorhizobium sp.]|nr:hypothetical protein [Mesorhizobium sp.]